MSEQFKHNDFSASAEQDVAALIRKMQQQLSLLEKKIDILINQSQQRPFRERPFSKPYRSFDRPHRSFEKRPGEENRGRVFDPKNKPFHSYRRKDSGR